MISERPCPGRSINKKLYDFIIASLQDTLVDKEEICEEVIKKIHSLLREQWK